jgi:hypothetical protein
VIEHFSRRRAEILKELSRQRHNATTLNNDESPADAGLSDDGRGGFRTCDLSRVKRDEDEGDVPPGQGTLF